jgi:hypothetical protein
MLIRAFFIILRNLLKTWFGKVDFFGLLKAGVHSSKLNYFAFEIPALTESNHEICIH